MDNASHHANARDAYPALVLPGLRPPGHEAPAKAAKPKRRRVQKRRDPPPQPAAAPNRTAEMLMSTALHARGPSIRWRPFAGHPGVQGRQTWTNQYAHGDIEPGGRPPRAPRQRRRRRVARGEKREGDWFLLLLLILLLSNRGDDKKT